MTVDEGDASISIPIGIVIGLLASFVQSLGLTIQRKSHVLNQALPEELQRVEHRRPLWLLGFAIFISSNLFGSVVQIASLPVVILAPLGAVSLLWNAFFARILLGDVFSPWMVLGTLLIAGGAVLIAIFGIVPTPTHSLEDLLRLFNRPAFIVYFSLLGTAVLVCLAVAHIVEYSYFRRYKPVDVSPPLSPLIAPNSAPSILTTATTANHAVDPTSPSERTPLIDRKPHSRSKSPSASSSIASMIISPLAYTQRSPRTPVFLAASYASISGILSGMCLLFAKSGVELLLLTLGGDNQFWRWQAWVLVISLIIFALFQLWYMHKGLVLADPTLVCPLAFCFYNLSSIVNGLVYFDQFSDLSTPHLLLVLLGIAILLAGVWVISFPPEGGRGVDIGTWTAGEPATELMSAGEESDVEAQDDEPYEDEPLPMDQADIVRGRSQKQANLSVITEPPASIPSPQLSPRPPTSPAQSRWRVPGPHSRQQTDSALLTSPPRRSLSSYTSSTGNAADGTYGSTLGAHPEAGATAGRRRRRTTLDPIHGHAPPFSNPMSPPAPTLSGFSIGLSPISPGFSIVPRERRRRPTPSSSGSIHMSASGILPSSSITGGSGGGGRAAGDDAAGSAGPALAPPRSPLQMRRVVSEGDAAGRERRRRATVAAGDEEANGDEPPHGTDVEQGTSGVQGAVPVAEDEASDGRAQDRWRWLRSVFSTGGS